MSTKRVPLILLLVIAFVFITGSAQVSSTTAGPEQTGAVQPVTMTVPFGPIPVESMNGTNIAYELEFSGTGNMSFVPEKLEVVDTTTGKVIYTPDTAVLARTSHAATVPPPTAEEILNGTGKLPSPRINIWFTIPPADVPDRLTHQVILNRTADGLEPLIITGGDVTVRKDLLPVVIGPPVRGPGWVIMETTSPVVHHATSQITMFNVTRVPQRYAQDFLYLDPATGTVVSGNETIARNYFGFGKELFSVGDGTVVYAKDGVADIEITTQKLPPSIDTALGNGVVIDLGDRKYACYGHMVNGSVRVKVGDTVTEGQVIGLMGNTGNSDAPHLHFQVITDNPLPLGGEGYPIVYRSFNITGKFDEENVSGTFFNEPVPQANRLMENDVIVSFP